MFFKKIFLAVLFLSFISAAVSYGQRDDKPRKSPEEMATKMADLMKTNLNLSDEQYKSVYSIFLNNATERMNNKSKFEGLSKEERKNLKKQNRENMRKQLQGVLTSEQIKKWEENKKMKKEKRKDKMGKKNKNKRNSQKPQNKF